MKGKAISENLSWSDEDLGEIQKMRLEFGCLNRKSSGPYMQRVGSAG